MPSAPLRPRRKIGARFAQLSLLIAYLLAPAVPALAFEDQGLQFAAQDAEMSAAQEQAFASLPAFFTHVDAAARGENRADEFMVKVGIATPNGTEHIWMSFIGVSDGQVSGMLVNEPVEIEGLQRGDRYRASLDQVSDWSYWEDELIYGNYTTRLMLPRLPAQEAAEWRAILAPLN